MEALPAVALALFLLSAGPLLLVFLVYPLLTGLGSRLRRPRPAPDARDLPRVSLITVVRNGEELIRAKIENALAVDYPAGRREVIVYSDGSTDGTVAAAAAFAPQGVRVLAADAHGGKIAGMNAAVAAATGEVLVFSDADAHLAPDALLLLVRVMDDPRVGGVCGQRTLVRDSAHLQAAQADYVRFDSWIKRMESGLGRITSNDGKLYAVRRELFRPLPPAVTDDLFTALEVIDQGREFRFEPRARALIRTPSRDLAHEVRRRRRIVCRSLHGIRLRARLLHPLRFGWFAVGLLVNKVLRRLLPLALLGLLASSAVLAVGGTCWRAVLALQAAGYLAALAGLLLPAGGRSARLASRALYFCAGQYGTLLGLGDFLAGRTVDRWEPLKSDRAVPPVPDDAGKVRVAYILSRFPKITETFVLFELLELVRLGFAVDVYPLLRERAGVRHPEVDHLLPHVRFLPLWSARVLAANLYYLVRRPAAYAQVVIEALAGTCGSLRFFAGAVVFLPVAVRIACEAERRAVGHLHAHFAHHPALAALIVHRLTGIPFSFTAHGSDLHMDQRMLDRKVAASAFVVAVSEYNRQFILERTPAAAAGKVRVVRCGVDPERFVPAAEAEPAAGRPFALLCIAALREVKGHRVLLEACRRLRERGVEFACDLIGGGPLAQAIRAQVAAAGLAAHVRLHGALPGDAVVRFLRQADVLVLASVTDPQGRREGIPVVLMEAMACGLPVVSSRQSGIPDLVSAETGILTTPGDPAELAEALERLSRDPAGRRRMGKAGREKVLRDHDQRKNAAELARLFRLVSSPHGASS